MLQNREGRKKRTLNVCSATNDERKTVNLQHEAFGLLTIAGELLDGSVLKPRALHNH
jgi:hypothetical protein